MILFVQQVEYFQDLSLISTICGGREDEYPYFDDNLRNYLIFCNILLIHDVEEQSASANYYFMKVALRLFLMEKGYNSTFNFR